MPIFNIQPKTIPPSTPNQIPPLILCQITQISDPDLAAVVSFSIFERPRLHQVLQQLAPNFVWPKQNLKATAASHLYFKCKQNLIDEVVNLPSETPLCGAIDCWTTKDQSESYLAIVLQWINPNDYIFRKSLVAFKSIHGAHSGEALSWSLWEALSVQGMIKQLFSITADNAVNNTTMMGHLQHKVHGINIIWDREQCFH
ncbi:hypothetical protein O181_073444 [Austropuccinia psidii MF-1]|uniref:HAT C-terminal dimerisation domain-containing protein n=1 Tax=Austropuccinia psidii MF-1 TaxID=1389203 RepID=A0A9Q3F6P5_9BASI|nr:hypothetical protein [Austropuccinia psidii MF-1]